MVETHWRGSLTNSSSVRAWGIGRREWLLLATVVLLPLPLVALTGAGLPLPGLVEQGLESLLPSASAPGHISTPSRPGGAISGVAHRPLAGSVNLPTTVQGNARLPAVRSETRAAAATVPGGVATTPASGIGAVAIGGAPASGTTGHKQPGTSKPTRVTGSRATLVRSSTSPSGGPTVGSLSPGHGDDGSRAGATRPRIAAFRSAGARAGGSSSTPRAAARRARAAAAPRVRPAAAALRGMGGAGSGNGAGGTIKTPVGSVSLAASGNGGAVNLSAGTGKSVVNVGVSASG